MLAVGPLRIRPHRAAVAALGLATALATAALWPEPLEARREAAPAGSVALCGIGDTCRTIGCHVDNPFGSPTLTWELVQADDSPLPAWWVPGRPLELKLAAQDVEAFYMGFQLAAVLDCPFVLNAGRIELLEPMRTTTVTGDLDVEYLTHSCTCLDLYECCGFVPEVSFSGDFAWTFRWEPPRRGSGPVSFQLAFNSANGDGTPDNDRISIGEVLLEEEPCPPVVDDLRVRKAACDPAAPGEPRVEIYRESGEAMDFLREADGADVFRQLLPTDWPASADCRPAADGRTLVAWSAAPACELGGEGWH